MSSPDSTASASSSQIESELLAEVQKEMVRRGTTLIPKTPDRADDLPAALCATAILATLAILAGTGVMMALVYAPTADDAYASVAWMQMSSLGGLARAMHWHASNLLILLSAAYLAYLLWRGMFRKPEHGRWWRAGMMLALAAAAGFTGQLLPYDQNALHGTAIRISYIQSLPGGDVLAGWMTGTPEIGTATVTRFFGLHVLVIPALLILVLRRFWKDSRSEKLFSAQLAVPVVVLLLLGAAGFLVRAPLGLGGTLSEPYPDARPEWWALPLYELLKILPAGVLHMLTLALPPLLGAAVVIALPLVEKVSLKPPRLLKPLRISLIVGVVAFLGLSIVPLVEDSSDSAGWFRKQSLADLMPAMGTRNTALGNTRDPLPWDTYKHAQDLKLLHERIRGVYPDDLDAPGRAQWDEWADQGAAFALELQLANDDTGQREARLGLRKTCQKCHDAHDKGDIRLDPEGTVAAATKEPVAPKSYFFDQALLESTKPNMTATTTKRIMDQGKFRLGDILAQAGITSGEKKRSAEQALVDLRAVTAAIGKLYEKNNAVFLDEQKWNNWVKELATAVEELAQASNPEDVGKKMAAVGKACETCHEGADEPDEPIEWAYSSLLK
ncbi:MAG: cytochrome b N-terminal domain-containing protein [Planctomycetes bacterium]|nr:cytochrome b N-terminal domain-containing protein [Planctomycetota bacterium]